MEFIASIGSAFTEMFSLFGLEVLIGGMLSGVMYSLVGIGFVLIYKSSGVFNFAQGTMLLFAALTFVSLTERQVHPIVAFSITTVVMIIMGIIVKILARGPGFGLPLEGAIPKLLSLK